MPRKPISFELDFMIKDIFPRFTVKQFDDVSFNIKPKNQGLDYNTTGMIGKIFVGVNNDMFMQTTGITVSNNNINILLDKNMLQKSGRAYAEVELTDSAGTITSSSFIFDIDPKIGEGGQIPGEYEGFVEKYERLISEFKTQVSSTINNCNNKVNITINNCNTNVDNKLNSVDSLVNVKISDFEKRFNRLTSSQQQDAEVIDARDGETSLKARLDRDIEKTNKELDKIKKLEESTVSTVTTESDFTTVEATSNGYFEDVKLEGKTLVNLNNVPTTFGELDGLRYSNCFRVNLKANTDYTFINMTDKKIQINGESVGVWFELSAGEVNVKSFQSDIDSTEVALIAHSNFGWTTSDADKEMLKQGFVVLEGDHTQNPPEYFEGLMSVGQDVDEVVVSSVKGDGNLIDIPKHYEKPLKFENSNKFELVTYIRINQDTDYTFTANYSKSNNEDYNGGIGIYLLNSKPKEITKFNLSDISDKVTIHQQELKQQDINKTFNSANYKYFAIYVGTATNSTHDHTAIIDNTKLVKSSISTDFEEFQSNKKPLLYYNNETQVWEKPILREWDSIEKHADGKYYYHKRSGEVVLNGNEFWELRVESDSQDVISFNGSGLTTSSNSLGVVCDKFPTINAFGESANFENIFIATNTRMQVRILKSKLSTQDISGFKAWLQANPTTVVYQLAQEEVYECTNIDLITYANETNYVVSSGAIVPKTTLKVHNNISNVVSLLQKKVSLLESNVKASQEVQDMMILETDMRMLDIELALMEFIPMTLNLGGSNMLRSATYFNFLKNHIINETYEKEYLENVMNKYLATGRINQDEYNELYKMLYPPVYDIELPMKY